MPGLESDLLMSVATYQYSNIHTHVSLCPVLMSNDAMSSIVSLLRALSSTQVLNTLIARNASTPELLAFLSGIPTCIGQSSAALLPLLATIQAAHIKLRPRAPPQQQLLVIFTLFPGQFYPSVPLDQKADFATGIGLVNQGLSAVGGAALCSSAPACGVWTELLVCAWPWVLGRMHDVEVWLRLG